MSGCLATVGELAQHGIWYAAQLSAGVGLWLLRPSLPATIPAQNCHTLLQALAGYPQRARIDQDRALLAKNLPPVTDALVGCGAGPPRACPGAEALAPELRTNREGLTRNCPWQRYARLPDNVLLDLKSDT